MTLATAVVLKCPMCGHFLCEVEHFGRGICKDCGCEITFRSKERRRDELTRVTNAPIIKPTT